MIDEQDDLSSELEIDAEELAREVGAAIPVRDHVERDVLDACGYCGQFFGPETVVIEKNLYGRLWRFCDESCYAEFLEHSNFKDEDLDAEKERDVTLDLPEKED